MTDEERGETWLHSFVAYYDDDGTESQLTESAVKQWQHS